VGGSVCRAEEDVTAFEFDRRRIFFNKKCRNHLPRNLLIYLSRHIIGK
jgi:hypothetical protein